MMQFVKCFLIGCLFFVLIDDLNAELVRMDTNDSLNKYVIKLEVLFGGVQFERKMTRWTSINFGLGYNYKYIGNPKRYDFQIVPEYRFYFPNKSSWPHGFFIGTYPFYKEYVLVADRKLNNSYVYSREKIRAAGLGFNVGFQREMFGIILMDVGMGLGYNFYFDAKTIEGLRIMDDKNYLMFIAGISVGYAF